MAHASSDIKTPTKELEPVITDDKELNAYISKHNKVVVLYSASWCVPCKPIKELINKSKKDYPDFKFVIIDIDVASFDVGFIPHVECFYNGYKKYILKGREGLFLLDSLKIMETLK